MHSPGGVTSLSLLSGQLRIKKNCQSFVLKNGVNSRGKTGGHRRGGARRGGQTNVQRGKKVVGGPTHHGFNRLYTRLNSDLPTNF